MRASLLQLTLARFREFLREPEAIFWTFVFPFLLAAGLEPRLLADEELARVVAKFADYGRLDPA